MFWDRIAGVYDVFVVMTNRKVNRELCRLAEQWVNPEEEVLECACGTGMLTACMAGRCKSIVATDLSRKMLERTERKCAKYGNVRYEVVDISRLPYPDNGFDKVIAGNVLHLMESPEQALEELIRVCRPGGTVIIPTYVRRGGTPLMERILNRFGAGFKQGFTFDSYRTFFEQAGYKDVQHLEIRGKISCAIAMVVKS